jgi:hypothetical protein
MSVHARAAPRHHAAHPTRAPPPPPAPRGARSIDKRTGEVVAIKLIDLEAAEDEIDDIQKEIAVISQASRAAARRDAGSAPASPLARRPRSPDVALPAPRLVVPSARGPRATTPFDAPRAHTRPCLSPSNFAPAAPLVARSVTRST